MATARSPVPEEIRVLVDGLAAAIEECRPILLRADNHRFHKAWGEFCDALTGTQAQFIHFKRRGVSTPAGLHEAVELLNQLRCCYGISPEHVDEQGRGKEGYRSFCDWERERQRALSMLAGFRTKRVRPAIPMTAEDELILATLADAYPAAVNQSELEGLTNIARQRVGPRLEWLESKRYIKRPEGTQRKGHAITAAGLSAIGRPVEGPH